MTNNLDAAAQTALPPLLLDVLGAPTPTFKDPNVAFLHVDDLAAVRGDGVFETLMLRGGEVKNLDLHFDRFLNSAAMLDMPAPDRDTWLQATELIAQRALELSPIGREQEAALRWVYSRGREGQGVATGWITVNPVSEEILRHRAHGVKVMTAERGFKIDLSQRSPWALVGAKTLSYAANMAALRYAKAHGLDDVIFISDEGLVLEGPTSTVVALRDGRLITPPVKEGILAGTTQAGLFALAEQRGWEVAYQQITVPELQQCDGVWLLSSVRVHARVTELDGVEMPRPALADEVEALVAESLYNS